MKIRNEYIIRSPKFKFDQIETDEDILQLLKNIRVKEAIYYTSRTLYFAIEKLLLNDPKYLAKKETILQSAFNYLLRMSTNPVPFGSSSGVSIAFISDNKNYQKEDYKIVDIDGDVYQEIIDLIISNPISLDFLLFTTNSTLVRKDITRFEYREQVLKNTMFKSKLTIIETNEILDKIYELGRNKIYFSLKEIFDYSLNIGYDEETIRLFMMELLASNIVVTSLHPIISNDECRYKRLLATFSDFGDHNKLISKIQKICRCLQEINMSSSFDIDIHERIYDYLIEIGVPLQKIKAAFVVTSYTANAIEINDKTLSNIDELIKVLIATFDKEKLSNSSLEKFTSEFINKYGDDKVSLIEVMDSVYGIGYPINTNVRVPPIDINIPNPPLKKSNKHTSLSEFDLLLLEIMYSNKDKNEVQLFDYNHKIKEISEWENVTCDQYLTMLNYEIEEEEETISFHHAAFVNIWRLTSRFGNLSSEINQFNKKLQKNETDMYPNKMFADFNHFIKPNHLNISSSDSYFPFELCYLSAKNSSKKQIILENLYLVYRKGQLILFDDVCQKEVAVRFNSAINYSLSNNSLVSFLGDYQYYKRLSTLTFQIPSVLKKNEYLPAIKWKNIYLSPQQWNLSKDFLKKSGVLLTNIDSFMAGIKILKIPNRLFHVVGEDRYFIDLEYKRCIKYIFDFICNNPTITLQKAHSSHTSDFNQVILFGNGGEKMESDSLFDSHKVKEKFDINNDYLNIHIYFSEKSNHIQFKDILKTLKINDSNFFFIKYFDSDFHYRLRIKTKFIELDEIIDRLGKMIKDGKITRYQIIPFFPERTRYGGNKCLPIALKIFEIESLQIIEWIDLEQKISYTNIFKWLFIYIRFFEKHIDIMSFLKINMDSMLNEFDFNNRNGRTILEKKYKELIPEINIAYTETNNIIEHKLSIELQKYFENYEGDKYNLFYSCSSLIHMFINRAAEYSPRKMETLFYFCMNRYLTMIQYKNMK